MTDTGDRFRTMSLRSSSPSPSPSSQNLETYSRSLTLSVRPLHDPNNVNGTLTPSLQTVRVTLSYPHPTSSSGLHSSATLREIQLRLTNDSDPQFYYHLRITEAEYSGLKQHQGLLVDFNGFPSQLIGLLDKCGDDKFQLVLNCGRDFTVLDIVESNPFKYLSHLSLQILPGTDTEVKKYLSLLTAELKKEIDQLNSKYQHVHSSAEIEIGKLKNELKAKEVEVGSLRDEMRNELSHSSEKYFRDLTSEKEKLIRYQTELCNKYDAERLDLEKRHRETISTLETKILTLESEKRSVEQESFLAANKMKELESKIKNSNEDFKLLTEELNYLRRNNSKLDADYHEKQRIVGSLVNKSNTLEQELKDKVALITRQQDLITNLNDKVANLEDRNSKIAKEVDDLKAKFNSVNGELQKGNEIIRKLQEDGRQLGKKVKLQGQIIASQETQINEKTFAVVKLSKELEETKENFAKVDGELKEVSKRLGTTEELIKTHEATLESKENQICWLNKQLNELQGLSNLNKFRETLLNDSTNKNKPGNCGGGGGLSSRLETSEIPSWMNIYHSTAGVGNSNNNTSLSPNDKEQTSEGITPPILKKPASTQPTRAPTWARSNKATLDSILHKPMWKK